MSLEQWVNEAYELLCQSQGPVNETEKANLRGYAEAMASHYIGEGMTPQEAHEYEASC